MSADWTWATGAYPPWPLVEVIRALRALWFALNDLGEALASPAEWTGNILASCVLNTEKRP